MNTPSTDPGESLKRMELAISHFLRWGVIVSGLLLAAGWVLQLAQGGQSFTSFREYHAQPLRTLLTDARDDGQYSIFVMCAGLAVLVSLPMIRVLLTGLLFLKQKDWIMAGLAFFVSAVLVGSFLLGIDL